MSKLTLALSAAIAALAWPAAAPAATPLTAEGKPDLSGAWSNASLTPLARPRTLGKLELDRRRGQGYIAQNAMGGATDKTWKKEGYSDPNAGAPDQGRRRLRGQGLRHRLDVARRGHVADQRPYRSSNIVEPANGQLPYRDPAAAAQRAQVRGTKYALGNDPYAARITTLSERCLIGFGGTGGPGMLSVLYNNNYQFVLTKDHLAIEVEMAHDARIIPIFASATRPAPATRRM